MSLTDDEREALRKALEALPDDILLVLRKSSDSLLRNMEDINSSFPATQEFLNARGFTNVRQLDKTGRAELIAYLRRKLQSISN